MSAKHTTAEIDSREYVGRYHKKYSPPKNHLATVDPRRGHVAGNEEATMQKLAKIAEALHQLRLKQAREEFPAFMEYCFYDETSRRPYQQQWFHDEWSDAWDNSRRCIIIAPRDHGKTSCVVGRIVWELGRNPNLRIKVACAADGRAKERLFEIVQHIEYNERVHEVFPDLKQDKRGEWSKHKIVVERSARHRDASVEALGITATATGGRCVVPGTLVYTDSGMIPIEQVTTADKVLVADKRYCSVAAVQSRPYSGTVFRFRVAGARHDTVLTPEHLVMADTSKHLVHPKIRWKRADEITMEDRVMFPNMAGEKRTRIGGKDYVFLPIESIEQEQYSGDVFDIAVPDANVFCTPDMVVHNCDLLIADDVVDRRNALSFPKLREAIKQAWKSDWTNLLEPDSRVWYICTLWHKDDLSHELMNNPAYRTLFYSVGDDYGALWPDKWPSEELHHRAQEIGSIEFNRGFKNKVLDDDTKIINDAWIRFEILEKLEAFSDPKRAKQLVYFTSYDTAVSVDDSADYSAFVVIAVDPVEQCIYVPDAWHARKTVAAQSQQIWNDFLKYRPERVFIEKIGQSVVDEWAVNDHPQLANYIEVTKPKINKVQRLIAVTPLLEQGRVIFSSALDPNRPTWTPGREALIHELNDFPFGKHDDLVDAFSQALTGARYYLLDTYSIGIDGVNGAKKESGGDGFFERTSDEDHEQRRYLF